MKEMTVDITCLISSPRDSGEEIEISYARIESQSGIISMPVNSTILLMAGSILLGLLIHTLRHPSSRTPEMVKKFKKSTNSVFSIVNTSIR